MEGVERQDDRAAAAGAEVRAPVALVVTYNRLEKLKPTVERLLAVAPAHLSHLVVVDNASTDGTAGWLASLEDSRLDILRLEHNGGGAGGFEAGLRRVVARYDPDWICLMDDDARPASDALARFQASPRDDAEAWLASVYYPDGRICEMNRPWVSPFGRLKTLFATLTRGRDGFHLDHDAYGTDTPSPVDGGSFVGLFLSRRGRALAGWPDGRLFIYGDDVLYTLALSRAGGRVLFDPKLRFEHDCKSVTAARALRPLWKTYYHHRNLLRVYQALVGPVLVWPLALALMPKWLLKARHYSGERGAYLGLLRWAVPDGLLGRFDRPHGDIIDRAQRSSNSR